MLWLQKLVKKLFDRYMMEKARTNMYTPHESEEMSISINRLYVENRRLVNLIQRLTKDSEEHAKSWYADYNIRNYDIFAASTLSNTQDNFGQINDPTQNVGTCCNSSQVYQSYQKFHSYENIDALIQK